MDLSVQFSRSVVSDSLRPHEPLHASPPCPSPTAGESIYRKLANKITLVAQTVKNLPAVQETWVQSLGWGDLLKKEMATHSSVLS